MNSFLVFQMKSSFLCNLQCDLIAMLYLFYWWSKLCQAFHLKPLFSGVYEQTVEKKMNQPNLGIRDLGSVEGTCFTKVLNSQLFFKVVSSTERIKGISLVK